jgi:hypothetical protein
MKVLLAALLLLGGLVYACEYADINKDHYVNLKDVIIVGAAYGSQPGDKNWNPAADLNNDGIVNLKDAVMIGVCFGYNY